MYENPENCESCCCRIHVNRICRCCVSRYNENDAQADVGAYQTYAYAMYNADDEVAAL